MPPEPSQVPVSSSSDSGARQRLQIHGIREMPAGYDAEVAELFRDLRSASSLSEADLAQRLGHLPRAFVERAQSQQFAQVVLEAHEPQVHEHVGHEQGGEEQAELQEVHARRRRV